jgi:hypothetical protein
MEDSLHNLIIPPALSYKIRDLWDKDVISPSLKERLKEHKEVADSE